jgi:hypothetical protein
MFVLGIIERVGTGRRIVKGNYPPFTPAEIPIEQRTKFVQRSRLLTQRRRGWWTEIDQNWSTQRALIGRNQKPLFFAPRTPAKYCFQNRR